MRDVKIIFDPARPVVGNARDTLPLVAKRFFKAGRKALETGSPLEDLHRFRLRAKRFRYTLELFQPIYGAELGRKLASLRTIQQHLGIINDCVVTRKLLAGERSGEAGRLRALLDRRIGRERGALEQFWRGNFDAPGESRRWVQYLAAYPGRTRRS